MKTSKFTEEQIVLALRQVEAGFLGARQVVSRDHATLDALRRLQRSAFHVSIDSERPNHVFPATRLAPA